MGEREDDGTVTQREFDRTLGLLEEIRLDIKTDVAALSTQLADTDRRITGRQDVQNGRTAKNEASVIAAHDQIAALIQSVSGVQSTVTYIKANGCDKGARDARVAAALMQAGLVPETGEFLDMPDRQPWTRRKTAGAIVGAGVGGSIVTALAPHLGPTLHWIATLFEHGVR